MATLAEIFTNIATAIRNKTGDTGKLTPIDMISQINSLISPYAFGTLTSDTLIGKVERHYYGTSAENKYYATLSAGYTNDTNTSLSYVVDVCDPSLTFTKFVYTDRSGMVSTATTDYLIYLAAANGSSDASFVLNKNLTSSDIKLIYSTAVTANTISFGNYGIISNLDRVGTTLVINNDLTRSSPFSGNENNSCHTNEYAFLITINSSSNISYINKSLTKSYITKPVATPETVCGANAEVAMFLGFNSSNGNLVYVKNDLTVTNLLLVPTYRYHIGTTSNDYYILFGGGIDNIGNSNIVDAYDANLSKVIAPVLSGGSHSLLGTHIGKFMLFELCGTSSTLNNYYVI